LVAHEGHSPYIPAENGNSLRLTATRGATPERLSKKQLEQREHMTSRERIEALVKGETPDRPAVTVWRHFYHLETTAESLAEAMCGFQERFQWDLMKINPRASYHLEDWGNVLEWSKAEFSKHKKTKFAVENVADWDKIDVLQPSAPVLAELLKAVTMIRKRIGPDLHLLMTMFTPLSIAGDLVKNDQTLLMHLAEDKARVLGALDRIAETFRLYAIELRNAGADGLFYATTQWASRTLLTYEQYQDFGRKFDLIPLKATGDDALNLLHVCASDNYLAELSDYPTQITNWDESDPTNLSLADGISAIGDNLTLGGLDHNGWLLKAAPEEIEFKIRYIYHRHRDSRFIFGPGCSIPPETPMENLQALADTVASLKY
jgi:uroporphyrinogen decarboxylase